MENLKPEIPRGFEIIPKTIIKSKHSYICKTSSGTKVIQKTAAKETNLKNAHSLKNKLEECGYPIYDKFYISVQNLPYFIHDGEKYIMTDYYELSDSDFSDGGDVKKVIQAAALFHKLSKNTNISFDKNTDILKVHEKLLANFKSVKKNISLKGSFSEFDVLFIKNYDYFFNRAKDAVSLLSDFSKKTECSKNGLCHGSIKEETAVKNKGVMSLISFENVSEGIFLSDLSDIINRYIRKHTPPPLSPMEILDTYLKINPISDNEIKFLKAIIKFPAKYIKICCDFYSKGMPFVPNSVINHLKCIILQKNIYENYTKCL